MSESFAGRHALVTGGGSGIGLAVAKALDAAGATVSLLGRNRDKLKTAATQLAHVGALLSADITDPKQVAEAVQAGEQAHGRLSILVNNAGAAESAPIENTDLGLWQRMLEANLTGTFIVTQATLPSLLAADAGRIVNVASTAGLKGYRYVSAYSAAKHGVIGLTRALATELASGNCTVNAVCPGFTETELLQQSLQNIREKTGLSEAQARKSLLRDNPQGRFIQPEEVADTVLWLCRNTSQSINGQAIAVAGGEVM
jgi:NAD(P)-dependent dehydrogenase (short-subunit alcohol dehydrogenase family)